jgi:hypothetical protein
MRKDWPVNLGISLKHTGTESSLNGYESCQKRREKLGAMSSISTIACLPYRWGRSPPERLHD